ncbi:MAG: hypothetical protein M3Q81_05385 [bacterium]|nr:hypothetical protein [bacterium]
MLNFTSKSPHFTAIHFAFHFLNRHVVLLIIPHILWLLIFSIGEFTLPKIISTPILFITFIWWGAQLAIVKSILDGSILDTELVVRQLWSYIKKFSVIFVGGILTASLLLLILVVLQSFYISASGIGIQEMYDAQFEITTFTSLLFHFLNFTLLTIATILICTIALDTRSFFRSIKPSIKYSIQHKKLVFLLFSYFILSRVLGQLSSSLLHELPVILFMTYTDTVVTVALFYSMYTQKNSSLKNEVQLYPPKSD